MNLKGGTERNGKLEEIIPNPELVFFSSHCIWSLVRETIIDQMTRDIERRLSVYQWLVIVVI